MYSFRELQKACKKNKVTSGKRLAVLGDRATQFAVQAIEGYSALEGIDLIVYEADYDQIDLQLTDKDSNVYAFKPDSILIWMTTEALYERFVNLDKKDRESFADDTLARIKRYWGLIATNSDAKILQMNFPELDDMICGQYSNRLTFSFIYQIRRLNYILMSAATENPGVFITDILGIQIETGRVAFFDPKLYYAAKMPASVQVLPLIAKRVTDIIRTINGSAKKCVITDLDNTLWGGVIGDDGLTGIEIGELGTGPAYSAFQSWLKQLKEHGIILAVCSKNDDHIAREPFEKLPDMVLRLSDFSVFVANWDDKASNIRLICQSLNIGMDSIVFIDDNPFERNLVKEKIPEIEVPDMPEDPALWLDFLKNENYFERASFSEDTSDRTDLYQTEFERRKQEAEYESVDDYLKGLQMIGYTGRFEPLRYSRIAELTQRSNQFNLRTVRYTEDDIKRIAESEDHIGLYFTLKDRFGDYGLISVVILEKRSDSELFIDTWLMSCRVLNRGMEEYVMNKIVGIAKETGCNSLKAEYIQTAKNHMVENIYDDMGFIETGEGLYELKTECYIDKSTYITEE